MKQDVFFFLFAKACEIIIVGSYEKVSTASSDGKIVRDGGSVGIRKDKNWPRPGVGWVKV